MKIKTCISQMLYCLYNRLYYTFISYRHNQQFKMQIKLHEFNFFRK